MRQYEKELGTLRSIMRSYIVQIDSLNTLNRKLTVEAASARKRAEEAGKLNEELTARVETLSGQVAAGSILKGRNFSLHAYNQSDRVTDRSGRVVRMMLSLTLSENELAPKGPIRVYVRVTDPEGFCFRTAPMPALTLTVRQWRLLHPAKWITQVPMWTFPSTLIIFRNTSKAFIQPKFSPNKLCSAKRKFY